MTSLRLFPTLLLAASALLGVKVLAIVFDGGLSAPSSIGVAMAQDAGAPAQVQGDAAGSDGDQNPQAMPAGDAASSDGGDDTAPGSLPEGLELGSSIAERKVLESLSGRRRELDKREKQFELRQQLLQQTEDRLQKNVDEMSALEASIKAMREEQEKKEQEELRGLVTMYESMKPKDAARIFDRLDLDILLKVSRAMKPRKMADVMAKMSPEVSERLTVALVTGRKPRDEQPKPAVEALPKIMGN